MLTAGCDFQAGIQGCRLRDSNWQRCWTETEDGILYLDFFPRK